MAQHGCWNNVILNDISDLVSDDTLEGSALSLLANIGIYVEGQDTEAGRQKSKKTFVQFVNRRNCKKVLSNKKKSLVKLIPESTVVATVQKYLPVRISNPLITPLPITAVS